MGDGRNEVRGERREARDGKGGTRWDAGHRTGGTRPARCEARDGTRGERWDARREMGGTRHETGHEARGKTRGERQDKRQEMRDGRNEARGGTGRHEAKWEARRVT
jgi:hypothetical protein